MILDPNDSKYLAWRNNLFGQRCQLSLLGDFTKIRDSPRRVDGTIFCFALPYCDFILNESAS